MADQKPQMESHLPIKGFLTIFIFLLILVAVTASVFGENQKIKITARRWINHVADRNYDGAYKLFTESARRKTSMREFKARAAILRMYLRGKYGSRFEEEYKFSTRKEFWIPWMGDNRRAVSVGLYDPEPGVGNEIKELFITPELAGPEMEGLLTLVREEGKWLVDEFNFNPEDHTDVLKSIARREKEIFTPTENGFAIESFVYDRRTISSEDRDYLIDTLSQALDELRTDAGLKKEQPDDIFKMIP